MQRSLAIILSGVFGWLLIFPLLLLSAVPAVPACCRKNGQHHCMMQARQVQATQPTVSGPAFATLQAKCPCCPGTMVLTTLSSGVICAGSAIYAGLLSHPAQSAQTEAGYRISHDRARQKRGPPSFPLS